MQRQFLAYVKCTDPEELVAKIDEGQALVLINRNNPSRVGQLLTHWDSSEYTPTLVAVQYEDGISGND